MTNASLYFIENLQSQLFYNDSVSINIDNMKPLYYNFLLRMLTILYKLSGYLYKDIVSKYIDDMRPLYNNFFLLIFSCLIHLNHTIYMLDAKY